MSLPSRTDGKRILIFKIGAVGDVSFLMPALQALHENLENPKITWVVGGQAAPLLENHPLIHKTVIVDEKKFYKGGLFSRLLEFRRVIKQLDLQYDLMLVAHRNEAYFYALRTLITGPLAQLVRTPDLPPKTFLRRGVVVPAMSLQESLAMKKLTEEGLGFFFQDKPVLNWRWNFDHIPEPKIDLPKEFVAVHAGGGENIKTEFTLKRWDKTQELVKTILERSNAHVVLVGAPSEAREAETIKNGILIPDRVINLCGRTSLRDLVGVLRQAKSFVGPDSGPLHIADSLGIPSLGIFGPTSSVSWGLLGGQSRAVFEPVPCHPCYRDTGDFPECTNHHRCMVDLSVDRVFSELKSLSPVFQNLLTEAKP